MIYETAVVLRAEIDDASVETFKALVTSVIKEYKGEVVLADDWGARTFSQPTEHGTRRGRYLYFLYSSENGAVNMELERRFRISDDCFKFLIILKGEEKLRAKLMKEYKNPFVAVPVDENFEMDDMGGSDSMNGGVGAGGGRRFSRRKNCMFLATKTEPDWKRPQSYRWLVNEFGKISPRRISGLSSKYQRMATREIKRARNIGLIGYMTAETTY